MTPEQLKFSILQYAFQGKLVEQRIEDGSAEVLYHQIQEEKRRLIKEGKLKKEKILAEISEDEIPFDIPDTWRWSRIGDIYALTMGQSPDGKSVTKGSNGMEFHQGKVFFGEDYILKSDQVTYEPSKIAEPNSVLLCVRAPVGIVNITDRELCIGRGLCAVKPLAGMTEKYALYSLRCLKDTFIKKATGTTFVAITGEVVKNQIIPLPPLEEQHRIVAKIEELLPYVDRYAEAYEKLEQFNAKFPEDMKKSILQYAIQGKLVEQRAEEGTAEELYQQIQDEKQKLIRTGKFKKDKAFSDITDDEMPFDIPDNWKWVRAGDIFNVGTGMTPTKSESRFYLGGTIPWVNSSLTSNRYIEHVDTMITQYALDNTSLRLYPAHTLIVAMYGQGKTRGQISELLLPATTNQACAALESYSYQEVTTKYVYYCFLFNYEKLRKRAEGTSQPNLNVQKIKETIIPFPPLGEQQRIVAKIEELLPYCEILSKCKQ